MKKIATIWLTVCMILSVLTFSAFAANAGTSISDLAGLKAISASGTYTLTADLTLGEKVTLNLQGLDITLDLGGKTVTGQLVFTGEGKINIKNGALTSAVTALTVPDGGTADDGASAYASATVSVDAKATVVLDGVTVSGKDHAIASKGNLTLKNATIKDATVGIMFIGSSKGIVEKTTVTAIRRGISTSNTDGLKEMEVIVTDATITTTSNQWNDCPIAWWGHGKLTVNSGTYKGVGNAASILIRNGDVTVNGGTFNAKDALKVDGSADECVSMKLTVTGGIFEGTRSGLYHSGGKAKDVTIMVSGGTFKGGSSGGLYEKNSSNAKFTFAGGLFDEEIPAGYCAENYKVVLNTETNMYEIKTHTHSYSEEWEYLNITFHGRVCSECGGGIESEKHTWSNWEIGEDGTHERVCTGCQYTVKEEHTWSKWVADDDSTHTRTCEGCGTTESVEHGLGKVYDTADGTTHKTTCSDCSHTVVSAHTYGDAKFLENGTHEKQCTACNYKLVEPCTEKDGVCETCGGEVKSGCASAVSFGLVAMLTVIGASVLGLRKKED